MFTFADLLTGAGVIAAATAITLFISVVKTAFEKVPFFADMNGAAAAFILSATLYAVAAFVLPTPVGIAVPADNLLMVFLSWLACAAAAVGVHKAIVSPVVDKVQEANS